MRIVWIDDRIPFKVRKRSDALYAVFPAAFLPKLCRQYCWSFGYVVYVNVWDVFVQVRRPIRTHEFRDVVLAVLILSLCHIKYMVYHRRLSSEYDFTVAVIFQTMEYYISVHPAVAAFFFQVA